ncbi:MAG: DUF4093 domain-containing protein [Clostridia bacterium]|nr:DUF4093 domain-containing protein [Clostridia bacterium]
MKLKIDMPVIVEGKYDKIKLCSVIDGTIITTEGFGIFKDADKASYIRRLCENGVIIATDSDGAGNLIRGHLKGILPNDKIHNVYIPQIKGKEKRKTAPSAEGFLGVEGTDTATLIRLFEPFSSKGGAKRAEITAADMYRLGLCGSADSQKKRKELCRRLALPENLSSKALRDALGRLYDIKEIEKLTGAAGPEEK